MPTGDMSPEEIFNMFFGGGFTTFGMGGRRDPFASEYCNLWLDCVCDVVNALQEVAHSNIQQLSVRKP